MSRSTPHGPRGIGCDPAGHHALRLLATSCLPLGRQHERQIDATAAVPGRSGGDCSCLRPAGAPPAGCVLQTTYHRGDGLGAQMYIRQSHLLEAAQLGCTFADTPLDARRAGKLAHATEASPIVASEVRSFFNLGSATAHGACPADAPPPRRRSGRREWCEHARDMRADPKVAARLRRAATSGAWCASEYPPMEMTGILFDTSAWLRARAVLRSRYLTARDPRPAVWEKSPLHAA